MKIALIVPAYHPTQDMIPMLERFLADPEFVPVVVNDGSGPEYDAIFARVPAACVLLNHEVNRGKGAALKTAMGYVLEHLPQCDMAVTADADGQHRYEDIRMVVASAAEPSRHAGAGQPGLRRQRALEEPLRQRHHPTGFRHRQRGQDPRYPDRASRL